MLFLSIGTIAMLIVMLYLRKYYKIKLWKTIVSSVLLTFAGLFGAKLMFVVESGKWGGISFFGALFLTPLIMALVAIILRVPIGTMLDICAPAECIMLALLKVHCKISGCCSGRYLMTNKAGKEIYFPSQIVELIAILLVMIVLIMLIRNGKYCDKIYLWYMILYGVTRFILNCFRKTTPFILGLPAGHFWSIICVVIGAMIYFTIVKINNKKENMQHGLID